MIFTCVKLVDEDLILKDHMYYVFDMTKQGALSELGRTIVNEVALLQQNTVRRYQGTRFGPK